jgi:uncharacterized protein YndB with AHSA1/START domain
MNPDREAWNTHFWSFMICRASTRTACARHVWLLLCGLFAAGGVCADDWSLSAEDLQHLDRREVVLPPPDREHSGGSFRAAIEIDAPAERVFRTMTDCAQALKFVPHLMRCTVLETAPDASWQTIEHEVSYGWYLPRASYVFRAAYEPFERVRFSGVRGDFRENEGVWELMPRHDGAATVVTYQAQVVTPRFFVPRWMVLASLKHDLPALMRGLRASCEAP